MILTLRPNRNIIPAADAWGVASSLSCSSRRPLIACAFALSCSVAARSESTAARARSFR